ncbi:stage VI sporulation protein D [Ectobacillus funiculus]|uniref:stage VI sporulation protein D n=1 Tax=Ectobacillus funiculus TaxID=137993 RepID=UPI00101D1C8C|nr:stage VI sporulation protein D [Ectobacillus funiculus]
MAADHQTSLSFSLKESVWFQKGQEVEQLLSIALDPDIVVQDRDYEIVVKGQLQLTGEYIPQDSEEASFSLRELSPVRTVDYVHVREDGVNELSHSFPLEISIPRSRVKQADDLYVEIEMFDYELPEQGCLQLLADIAIYGLTDQATAEEQIEGRVEEQEELLEELEDQYAAPAFVQEEEDVFEPFEFEVRKEPVLEEVEREEPVMQVELFGRAEETKQPPASEEGKEEFAYSSRDENALYLTRLFGRNQEEQFTKLRMYFVQPGDTVESIAERYDTNLQHLARINQLDDLYVSQGQVLYVPVSKTKSKSS